MPAELLPSFASSSLEPAVPPLWEALEWLEGGEPISTDGLVTLPDVTGLPARVAVRHLHRLGLRVAEVSGGNIVLSMPIAGSRVSPGDTIRLRYRSPVYD